MKTYKNGIYAVKIGDKGLIIVKPNDWISKYSAAIYNDFTRSNQFGRITDTFPAELEDPNKIFAGEKIYHLPDYWSKSKQPPSPNKDKTPLETNRKLTQEEKELIIETLKTDFNLRGENLKTIGKVLDYISYTDNALTLLEISSLLESSAAMAGGVATFSFIASIISPIGLFKNLLDANETGLKLYGLRAVAYTIASWAYDRAVPSGSNKIMLNISGSPLNIKEKYKKTWLEVSNNTIKSFKEKAIKEKVSEESLKLLFRSISNDSPRNLCFLLMSEMTKDLSAIEKVYWKAEIKTLYPE